MSDQGRLGRVTRLERPDWSYLNVLLNASSQVIEHIVGVYRPRSRPEEIAKTADHCKMTHAIWFTGRIAIEDSRRHNVIINIEG